MAGNYNISYTFKALDQLTPVIRKINDSIEKHKIVAAKAGDVNATFSQQLKRLSQQSNIANNSLVRLGAGYLSLSTAIGFGNSLIDTQVNLQNINASLKAVTGSQQKATEEFNFARQAADKIGVSFEDLIVPYTKFLAASKLSTKENRKIFTSFNQLSRAFGLTGEQTSGIFRALEQMMSKGKVMSEELRLQLGDRLPGALQLFADAAGMSTQQFIKLMEEGRVGAGILKNVADVIEKKYGVAATEASETLGASLARLKNAFFDLKVTTSTGIFSIAVIKSVQFLTANMDKILKIAIGLGIAFGVLALLKLPIILASLTAQFILSTSAALGLFKILAIFALTNPFGLILTTLGILILSSKKFREEFIKAVIAIKDIGKFIFSMYMERLNFLLQFLQKIGDFFTVIYDKVNKFSIHDIFGNNKIDVGLKNTSDISKTMNMIGLEGIINIKNAPVGTTAEMRTFGQSKGNLGLNMSYAGGL